MSVDPEELFVGLRVGEIADIPPPAARRPLRPVRRIPVVERSETLVRSDIVTWVHANGGKVMVKHQDGRGVKGTPDLFGVYRGRCVLIEVKRGGKVPTADQLAQLRAWQARGALVGWAQSVEHAEQILSHWDDPTWINPLDRPGDGRRPVGSGA